MRSLRGSARNNDLRRTRRWRDLALVGLAGIALSINPRLPARDNHQPDLQSEFDRQLDDCPSQDIAARLRLINWALDQGLKEQAEALYREILAHAPTHQRAYDGLLRLTKRRPLAGASEILAATRRLLPDGFRAHETARYIILSNATARWTRTQAKRLERTCDEFYRHTKRLGLRPLPLRHKLVCVLFQNRKEFNAFAAEHDHLNLHSWNLGYYSQRNDRIVLFDGTSEQDADEFTKERTVATTIHEAVHQLHYHTCVMNVHLQYPLWLCEGLATAFEAGSTNHAFGPEHDFEPRQRHFLALLEREELMSLRSLAQLDALPDTSQQTSFTAYNQSYALVSWLARKRRSQLRDYLMLLLIEPPGRPTAQRHLDLLEQAFGDVDRLEQEWLRDERRRHTNTRGKENRK